MTLLGYASIITTEIYTSVCVSLLLTGVAIQGARRVKPFMAEKRPDASEVADSIQHLNGRIDAVLYLVSVVVATISPALAVPLLDRNRRVKSQSQIRATLGL